MISPSIAVRIWLATLLAAGVLLALVALAGSPSVAAAAGPAAQTSTTINGKKCYSKRKPGTVKRRYHGRVYWCKRR